MGTAFLLTRLLGRTFVVIPVVRIQLPSLQEMVKVGKRKSALLYTTTIDSQEQNQRWIRAVLSLNVVRTCDYCARRPLSGKASSGHDPFNPTVAYLELRV